MAQARDKLCTGPERVSFTKVDRKYIVFEFFRNPFGFWYNGAAVAGEDQIQTRAGRLARTTNMEEAVLNNRLENIIGQWVK